MCPPLSWNNLRTNLADNRKRADSLFTETVELARAFQKRSINCAVLKGLTLPFESVPDSAFRSQTDIDFLVRESDAESAKECLAAFGYHTTAVSGSTWEFKAGQSNTSSLKNLYQVRSERALDVQMLAGSDTVSNSDRLSRRQLLAVRDHQLPALSPQTFSFCRVNTCSSICAASTREPRGFWSIGDTFVQGEMMRRSGTKWS